MKRAGLLLTLLLVASLVSAATLDLRVEAAVGDEYEAQVRSGVEKFLFGRMEAEATVTGHLDDGLVLTLSTETGSLSVPLPSEAPEVMGTLRSALLWDALSLIELPEGARLSYPLSSGFMIEGLETRREGLEYWVVDRDLKRRGSVRVMRVVEGDEMSVMAVQTSGGALLPHMGLERMGTFSAALSASISLTGTIGVEAMVLQPLPRYPLEVRYGIGYSTAESLTVRLGLGASLPLAHFFGTGNVVGRIFSIEGWADLGAGWDDGVLLSASARIGLSCRLSSWRLTALVGTAHAATAEVTMNQGLFFTLGTAYTYTP
ncbi:MAG: hypothetical protein QM434_03565 [Spirochaetota bacterium]|jgi:hypothetical protein|nr:hypothetical protein [Spirochaetota bacterium]